jgi:hypothetical protein
MSLLDALLLDPAPVTCEAVGVRGSFLRLHRVRAIHFCTQGSAECFVLFLPSGWGQAGTFNVIEDCILEQPGLNNTHETSLGGSVGDPYGSARSPIVRNNYANCTYVRADGSTYSSQFVAVASLSTPANNEFTLVTKRPHHREAGQNILLNGVLILNSNPPAGHPYFNRPFKIKTLDATTPLTKMTCEFISPPSPFPENDASGAYIGVDFHGPSALSGTGCVTEGNAVFDCAQGLYTDTGSTRDLVVRDNYYSNMLRGVNFDFNPVGGGAESPRLARTGVNLVSLTHSGADGKTANANSGTSGSGTPHGLTEGETVEISGALMPDGSAPPADTYNGSYPVHVVDAYNFTYPMPNNPEDHAKAPTASNPIRVGIYCLKRDSGDPKIAILETALPHQLNVGDAVTILGALRNGDLVPDGESYNDTVTVLAVVSSTVFKYGMKNDPGGNADASTTLNSIRFRARYQVRRFIFENNVCELHAFDINSANISIVPRGMQTIGLGGPPFMFPDAVVRGNFFRHINDTPAVVGANNSYLFAMRIGSFENTLIEDNLIGLTTPHLIHYTNGQAVNGFNNQTPDGTLLPVYSNFSGGVEPFYKLDGLEDKVSDAILMSLL